MGTPLRVVLAGGGTGGHLYPALNLAEELARVEGVRVMLVGARRGIDADVLPRRGHPYRLLPVEPLYRRRPWRNVRSAAAFLTSWRETARIFAEFPPDAVVGTGGYAAAPVLARAVRAGVPVAIQEQNSAPGITTRWFARRAEQVHLAYPEARNRVRTRPRAKVTTYGNPIRWSATPPSGEEARRALGLDPGPVVLVVGGSQGARALNEAVAACVAQARAGALPSLPRGTQLY
ncbi:MAG: UDP-N-acetylglucosamine--N-acetylmuramyl-(pentapeptide) pyrophosphoryl-undecaprenol N-acetylglucosamine transferase, partial [Gemmatimonadota bacterium]